MSDLEETKDKWFIQLEFQSVCVCVSVCVERLACVHKIKWTHLAASPETIVLTDLMSCGSDLVLL